MSFFLFDLGSTYSYISIKVVVVLNQIYDVPNHLIYLSTLVGDFMRVTNVYRSCPMLFIGF